MAKNNRTYNPDNRKEVIAGIENTLQAAASFIYGMVDDDEKEQERVNHNITVPVLESPNPHSTSYPSPSTSYPPHLPPHSTVDTPLHPGIAGFPHTSEEESAALDRLHQQLSSPESDACQTNEDDEEKGEKDAKAIPGRHLRHRGRHGLRFNRDGAGGPEGHGIRH